MILNIFLSFCQKCVFGTPFFKEKCNSSNSAMNFETKFQQHVKIYIEVVCKHFQLNLTKNINFIIKNVKLLILVLFFHQSFSKLTLCVLNKEYIYDQTQIFLFEFFFGPSAKICIKIDFFENSYFHRQRSKIPFKCHSDLTDAVFKEIQDQSPLFCNINKKSTSLMF